MNVIDTKLSGLRIVEPKIFGDSRGFFFESWNQQRFEAMGLPSLFVQDNLSFSQRGVLRGLHFQKPKSQGKLVYVLQGEVLDVALDIRVGSPTFGQWEAVILSAENKRQLYVPEGFAHGFCVRSETALFAYKCTEFYAPEHEASVLWNDPDLGIPWDVEKPQLSTKDAAARSLKEFLKEQLPKFHP